MKLIILIIISNRCSKKFQILDRLDKFTWVIVFDVCQCGFGHFASTVRRLSFVDLRRHPKYVVVSDENSETDDDDDFKDQTCDRQLYFPLATSHLSEKYYVLYTGYSVFAIDNIYQLIYGSILNPDVCFDRELFMRVRVSSLIADLIRTPENFQLSLRFS